MAKTALNQLQEQIEAVRSEAFAAGYAAAMQEVRDLVSRGAPGAPVKSASPTPVARRRQGRSPRAARAAAPATAAPTAPPASAPATPARRRAVRAPRATGTSS